MVRSLVPWNSNLPQSVDVFRREMDSLFDRFLDFGGDAAWLAHTYEPRLNVAESEEGYDVTAELPGMSANDFSVEVKDNQLWLTGEKKQETEENGRAYHRLERRYGAFRRIIPLGSPVQADKVSAEYKDGVLSIHIAKSEAAKPKRIPVKA